MGTDETACSQPVRKPWREDERKVIKERSEKKREVEGQCLIPSHQFTASPSCWIWSVAKVSVNLLRHYVFFFIDYTKAYVP